MMAAIVAAMLVRHYKKNAGQPRRRTIVFLLCFFLGSFGIHRFYIGKWQTGILWLLTGGLLGIGWLIDVILILMHSMRDADGKLLLTDREIDTHIKPT